MDTYNIVLTPSKDFSQALTAFSQNTLKDIHNGYCLEQGRVFPHITFCQFTCDEAQIIQHLNQKLSGFAPFEGNIVFSRFYIKPCSYEAEPSYHLGLEVDKSEALYQLHLDVLSLFEGIKLLIQTPSRDQYWPHLTIGRIPSGTQIPAVSIDPSLFNKDGFSGWTLEMGRGDEVGQYIGP